MAILEFDEFDWDDQNAGHLVRHQVTTAEAEEAAWWESHEDALLAEFKKATAEGRVGVGTVQKRAALPSTTIRLDPEDIAKAREQAAKRGLRYQTYLKMIIHEALRAEEERRSTVA